jgi:ankyrin repeat protein
MRHKIFIEKLFSYVTDYTLEALKKYMESLAAQISRKEGELSSYTDIKSLLCECREGKGKTVLHFAAARGDLQIFKYLLSLGADLNA